MGWLADWVTARGPLDVARLLQSQISLVPCYSVGGARSHGESERKKWKGRPEGSANCRSESKKGLHMLQLLVTSGRYEGTGRSRCLLMLEKCCS